MELVLRTSAILAVAWLCSRVMTRASAATRHLVWHTAILTVVVAPIIAPIAPQFALPRLGAAVQEIERWLGPYGGAPARERGVESQAMHSSQASPGLRRGDSMSGGSDTWPHAFASFWTAGALMTAVWFGVGWILSLRAARRAPDAPVAWQMEVNDLAARLRIGREVRLAMLATDSSPVTIGLFTSCVLLPPSALSWDADQRRSVLLHELSHVRRHDMRIQTMTQAACVMYWFNPMIWLAARALRRERERACDEEVLRHGARPSTYAAFLLDVARLINRRRIPSAALAMARSSELERRLLALLGHRVRQPSRAGQAVVLLMMVTSAVAILGATRAPSISGQAPLNAQAGTRSAVDGWMLSPTSIERSEMPARVEQATKTLETSPDERARKQAALALADGEQSASTSALVLALTDSSSNVREKAALALALQSGPDVVEPLIRALADEDSQVREKAALGLALRRDPRVVDPLLSAMADPDAQVREKAAIALGTSGDVRARAALEAATRDRDPQVREKAVTALMLLNSVAPRFAR
jgi:beta-lactamase regulating signal transducer with metallopeptidase domain